MAPNPPGEPEPTEEHTPTTPVPSPSPAPEHPAPPATAPPASRATRRQLQRRVRAAGRHPGDVLRVVLGGAVVALGAIVARRSPLPRAEENLFRLLNDLPDALEPPVTLVMQAGTLLAVVVAAAIALLAGRQLLARDLGVAGALAWIGARVLKEVVDRGRPAEVLAVPLHRFTDADGLGYPSGHAAVAAALATAAAPHLPRPLRHLAWAVVWVVAAARVYAGAHLPVDVIGGVALGWAIGAAVHLVLGAPRRIPSVETVRAALRAGGTPLAELWVPGIETPGSAPLLGRTEQGEDVFCKVLGREERDTDTLARAWRWVSRRGPADEAPFTTPSRAVEHEAYVALLAERAGVRTPRVATTAALDDGSAVLVRRVVPGRGLDTLPDVDDRVLRDLWGQVRLLRRSRIAHRELRAGNVVVDDGGHPWIVDLAVAVPSAGDRDLAADLAELLASLATVVGPERAVASAGGVLEPTELASALPLLAPLALSPTTRRAVRTRPGVLDEVRRLVARSSGTEPPVPVRLRRGGLSDLAVVAALGLAAGALLVWFGGPREVADSLERASPGWLAAGLAFSVAAPVCAAIAQLAVVERRPALPDAVVAQLAGSFADRVTPGAAGGGAIRVRFLQRGGLDASAATAAVTLAGAAVSVVHGSALLLVGAYVAGEGVGDVDLPDRWAVMVGVVVALAAVGLLLRAAPGRRPLAGPAGRGETDLASVLRRPVRGLVLLGGASGVIASTTLAFLASAGAFDAGVSPAEAALVSLAAAAVSTAAVTPGGLVATEGALVAGLTAVGSLPGPAVVTVLAFRVLTYWLPILVGGLSLRSSRRRALL